MSTIELGEKNGVSNVTIGRWLKEYRIPVRTLSEANLKGNIKPSKQEIEEMYLIKFMTTYEISEKICVGTTTVCRWLKEYGIQVRTTSEARLNGSVKPTKEDLEKMYLEDRMDTYDIGEKIRVANGTISGWLKEYKIPIRTYSESKLHGKIKPLKEVLERMYLEEGMDTYAIGEQIGVAANTVRRWLNEYEIRVRNITEARLKGTVKTTKEDLERMYSDDYMTPLKISEQIGVTDTTIRNWLNEYNIPIRNISEAKLNGDFTGERSHCWKGGLSFLPYCHKFNNKLKEKVRGRDNRTCQNCGKKENGRKHTVHHVHYDKENCYPDLITLCNSCNTKANSNRDEWESIYMNKLNDRGLLHWT